MLEGSRTRTCAVAAMMVGCLLLPGRLGPGAQHASAANISAALVVNGTLGDKGFFDSANHGMQMMHAKLGWSVKVLQASPTNPSQWLQNLQAVSGNSYNLVITGSTQMVDDITQVSKQDPNQKFIMFDASVPGPNIASIIYKQNEGSFLAGVLAAEVTTDTKDFPLSKGAKKVGLVGGENIPVINDFLVGFKKGVQSVNPKIQVQVSYVGSFSDPQTGYNQAKAMYDSGADVVFAVAGGSGLGVLKASKAANRYSIGVDSNQNGLYPGHVLASMVKRVDNSLFQLAKMFQNKTLKYNTTYQFGLKNKGVGLIIANKYVPHSVVLKINGLAKEVADGTIKVPTTLGGNG